jgi:mono/diheme cytochrome c family protein
MRAYSSKAMHVKNTLNSLRCVVCLIGLFALAGCDAPKAHYNLDLVYMRKQEKSSADFTPEQKQDVADILIAMFGSPDEPYLAGDLGDLVDANRIAMSAGPVSSDRTGRARGLYREHCSHCHGITGGGKGPTAPFLNPYPRDYRTGVFKFKATPKGARPRREDLRRVLMNGVAGTSMPSFKLLPESEREALIDYVIYLSIRGEVERALYEEMALELEEGERLIVDENPADGSDFILDVLSGIVGKWNKADTQVVAVPARPEWDDDETLVSIRRGRQLFYGAVANCLKCHGEGQLGDGETTDYDDWTKSFHDWTQPVDSEKRTELEAEYARLGGLKPRNIIPRNLRSGIFRGGRRPIDLYWRIVNGIDGSPMPAAMVKTNDADPTTKGLTSNDVWNIVDYVMALPYENMMATGPDQPIYRRERP